MLRREITYEDFDGNKVSDVFYFNISKPELVDMEFEQSEGLEKFLQRIIETKDHKKIIEYFKKIVKLAYGEKSEDGKRFIKSDELSQAFTQTAAYEVLFMELATDADVAALFLKGVLPKDLTSQLDDAGNLRELPHQKSAMPPPPPTNS